MRRPDAPHYAFLVLPLALLAACGGGGGGGRSRAILKDEVEPNDSSATANKLSVGTVGSGDVITAADVDYWKLKLKAGEVIRVELFATRSDQTDWNTAGNVPRLTLYDTDGTAKLLEHDYSGNFITNSWSWGFHDLDFPYFKVPATGTYYVAVTQDDTTTAGGEYGVRVERMDIGSIQEEAEPAGTTGGNDTAATAEAVSEGTVHGFHVDDESDYFSFAVPTKSIVRLELKAYRNGVFGGDDDYYDPEMNLYDTDGTTNLFNDDDSFFYDPAIQYEIDTPGTYFVEVLECCDNGDAEYFLDIDIEDLSGTTAEVEANDTAATANATAYDRYVTGNMDTGDTDFFSFTGTAGDMVRLQRFDSSNASGAADRVTVDLLASDGTTLLSTDSGGDFQVTTTILQSSGTFYARVTPDSTPSATTYRLHLERFKAARYETEPNDTAATASTFNSERRAAGVIGTIGDVDFFRFTSKKNRVWNLVIYADDSATTSDGFFEYSGHGSALDPVLTVRDPAGVLVATSDSSLGVSTEDVIDGLPTAAVSFLAETAGTFTVEVEDVGGDEGGATQYYVIELEN